MQYPSSGPGTHRAARRSAPGRGRYARATGAGHRLWCMASPPDPAQVYPFAGRTIVFLKPLIDNPHIEVGEYTYYHDPDHAADFATRNVLYSFGPERLIIGRY